MKDTEHIERGVISFKKKEIVIVKGLQFRVTKWSKGRLFLKMVRK